MLCVIRFVFSPASAYVLAELLLPPLWFSVFFMFRRRHLSCVLKMFFFSSILTLNSLF